MSGSGTPILDETGTRPVSRTYWLDLFTVDTWQEFRDHGASVSGFSEARMATVQRMKAGDYLLCYLTRVSRWVGILEVTGEPYFDESPIWASEVFPSRVPVKVVLAVDAEFGVPVLDMRDELSVFENLSNPNMWSGPFRGSPAKWKPADGEAVVRALQRAVDHPIERPLGRLRRASRSVAVPVDGPDDGHVEHVPVEDSVEPAPAQDEGTTHTEIQFLLARLGADMGFDVHVARNDTSRVWKGQRLGDLPRLREHLPQQFDPATNRTIELIDLLWLQGNAITAAFEIESTTSIYSGLLRMSDLLAMQPNIAIPLFLVAPDERRGKVIQQVNRPTFDRMKRPLLGVCRYISFDVLRENLQAAQPYVRYLKADWLQTISESCAPDDV
ncbi:EVE domain-containing protein [Blastococcus sp. BMG 814]|uniref:EVE domain-containing protein n=1 Tax=Blastococcus carthaginiensis TaxID=3050034 RepID=A0ABT9IIJ9_9ACTN|nr:EVE domain-containing protein [Blastococcus carthaginiensis]MDP5185052.1 EVE domain-containing protein [Blastococcus carthaginiensis]